MSGIKVVRASERDRSTAQTTGMVREAGIAPETVGNQDHLVRLREGTSRHGLGSAPSRRLRDGDLRAKWTGATALWSKA
jgi:hypothetical protein